MATMRVNETKLVLKYDDKNGNYTFRNFVPDVDDEELYTIARILNGFQADQAEKIVKVTTRIVSE
jgi:hypothetical protein